MTPVAEPAASSQHPRAPGGSATGSAASSSPARPVARARSTTRRPARWPGTSTSPRSRRSTRPSRRPRPPSRPGARPRCRKRTDILFRIRNLVEAAPPRARRAPDRRARQGPVGRPRRDRPRPREPRVRVRHPEPAQGRLQRAGLAPASTSTRSASRSASSPASRRSTSRRWSRCGCSRPPSRRGNTFILKPSEKDPSASIFLAELLARGRRPGRRVQRRPRRQGRGRRDPRAPGHRRRVSFVGSTPIARYIYETGHEGRQARPGPRRRQEPHDRAARRRHRHGRRRGRLGRLRLGRRALHGHRDDRRRRRRGRPARRGHQGPPAEDQGRARAATRPPRWARSSPRSTATRSPSYLDSSAEQGATVVADGREHPLYDESDGFFLGVSLIDHVTPTMDAYRDEIFGPVLTVVRVDDLRRGGRARQRQPVRQRHGDLHPRRRRGPPVPVRGQRRDGRHQRADPGAGRLLQLRRLEALAVRRPAHVRPRGHPVLHAGQDRDRRAGRTRARPRSTSASRARAEADDQTTPRPTPRSTSWPLPTRATCAAGLDARPTLAGADYTSDGGLRRGARADLVRPLGLHRAGRGGRGSRATTSSATSPASRSSSRATATGELRAFYNVCAHRGTKLLDDEPACGHVSKVFKCPYHAWSYDLDGRLVGTPNVDEDEGFERADYPLHAIARRGVRRASCSSTSPRRPARSSTSSATGTESITNFERYRLDELRVGVRIDYEVAANWKIVVENYNECLHCPTIHPELVQVVPLYRFGEVWDEETRDDGNWMIEGATSFTRTGTSDAAAVPRTCSTTTGACTTARSSSRTCCSTSTRRGDGLPRCYPQGPAHTTVVSEYLFRPETIAAPDFAPGARRRAVGPHQQAGLGGLRARPDRGLVAGLPARRVPAQGPLPVRLQRALPRARWADPRSTEADRG